MVRTRFFKRRAVRVAVPSLVLCGAVAAIAAFVVSPANATNPTCDPATPTIADGPCDLLGSITITGGGITLEAPATLSFPSTTLDGTNQSIRDLTANDDTYVVNDARGTSAGWNVTATATTFTCDTSTLPTPCSTTHTLPVGAFTTNGSTTSAAATTAPHAACTTIGNCTLPNAPAGAFSYPVTLDGNSTAKIFQADTGSGMGSITITNAEWWLAIAWDTAPGTYQSTITLATSSAP